MDVDVDVDDAQKTPERAGKGRDGEKTPEVGFQEIAGITSLGGGGRRRGRGADEDHRMASP